MEHLPCIWNKNWYKAELLWQKNEYTWLQDCYNKKPQLWKQESYPPYRKTEVCMSLCSKRTTSSIDIVDRNCSISNEVKDEIRRKLSEMKSFIQIGREENTSISTVMRIFHDIEVPHKELDYETVYLDEFRLTNSSDWHKN